MNRERHGDTGFAQWVCLDGAAVPFHANQKRERSMPAADTSAAHPAPERRRAADRQRQPELVHAGPDRLPPRPVVHADGRGA